MAPRKYSPLTLVKLARDRADLDTMTTLQQDALVREVLVLANDLADDLELSDEEIEDLLDDTTVEDDYGDIEANE